MTCCQLHYLSSMMLAMNAMKQTHMPFCLPIEASDCVIPSCFCNWGNQIEEKAHLLKLMHSAHLQVCQWRGGMPGLSWREQIQIIRFQENAGLVTFAWKWKVPISMDLWQPFTRQTPATMVRQKGIKSPGLVAHFMLKSFSCRCE